MPRRHPPFPLDDPRFEHDACGIGFVADASGRQHSRVLPLALEGLGSLAHRGAFAADGESSDGAGISIPLSPTVLRHLAGPHAAERPGVVFAFLPSGRSRWTRARALVEDVMVSQGLEVLGWRSVPWSPQALGGAAARSRPAFEQVIVRRPAGRSGRPASDSAFERRLIVARRHLEASVRAAEAAGDGAMGTLAVASASCRTVVYKGLVTGARLPQLYPDLTAPLDVPYALFHQRYATNTRPVWRLAQPFRWIAHNGEINTVRANREQVRGRTRDTGPRARGAAQLLATGPLLSADGSDSQSLDEALEALVATGWSLPEALLALVPEAPALRRHPHAHVATLRRRTAGFLAPWDGPAAIVFADGRRAGVLLDRNGLRPAAYAVDRSGLVAVASEAGAVPMAPETTIRRGRVGPGELLLVDTARGLVLEDVEAKSHVLRRLRIHDAPRANVEDSPEAPLAGEPLLTGPDSARLRYLAGLDAERLRLDVRTMAIDGHEPLWSMGDDTPTPGRSRIGRRAADFLRQAFAQVTNPAIDPERERGVTDLRVEIGRKPPLLGGPPRAGATGGSTTIALARPVIVDLPALVAAIEARSRPGSVRDLPATWKAADGPSGLERALDRLGRRAVRLATRGAHVLLISDRGFDMERLPIPAVLAVGAVHAALTAAGLRGRTDLVVDAADVLDVHALAMCLAAGATAVHPRLAIRAAREIAGARGAEDLSAASATDNLLSAFEAGLRKTLARMGISTVASYIGGNLIDTLDLAPSAVERCFPAAAAWPGDVTLADLARGQLDRRAAASALPDPAPGRELRLPDPGLARFRGDGEDHRFAPRVVGHIQALIDGSATAPIHARLTAYRAGLHRGRDAGGGAAAPRDGFRIRRAPEPVALTQVEPVRDIVRRFVVSAMSVGALSPEAHQALTIGIQRAGGAANTGEGGEDPAWYAPGPGGERRDARIKQVASARFGVTAGYLARAEQLEIKIAQGSKPGEGGQLPGRKATAYIAGLRRGQPGQSYISPPPHHDIYSIEDLAQLIGDLRAINPGARIGVKLVASRGVGTIAAGVAKAGATYIHLSGHAGGTGASPLSSIKHAGAPWELGLAEVHQVLLRNDLRDRVALRVDGGLQTGRDLLIAALLGAEEFAFGTAALVALGCDMARQCHLDTCPTGIATQRPDLRAKLTGTPADVEAFVTAVAEDLRLELAGIGATSVGQVVGASRRYLHADRRADGVRAAVVGAPWPADAARRSSPARAGSDVTRAAASQLEARLVGTLRGQGAVSLSGLRIGTAERSIGAALTGAIERGELTGPVRLAFTGAAGQSFGAFAGPGVHLHLAGQANDYVAKGLSGGTVVVAPETELRADGVPQAIAGNAVLYGATDGRLHLLGRAGMRFGVRNSGAEAVVDGIGPHGCEYMTGGVIVVLGAVGANFGAGMTGGRAYLHDPGGDALPALDVRSVRATRVRGAADPETGEPLVEQRRVELEALLRAHADVGSAMAQQLLRREDDALADEFWLVEPAAAPSEPKVAAEPSITAPAAGRSSAMPVAEPVPNLEQAGQR